MTTIGQKIIDGLEDFMEKLKRGDDIPITEVRRLDTQDGPMHTRAKKNLTKPRKRKK